MNAAYKQIIELAVESGRNNQGVQTRFVHYCYGALDEKDHESIPIFENFLFALALMKNRTTEQFQEGKAHLEKLLHFQNEEGDFPVYLHEYPENKDPLFGLQLLPIFHAVLSSFSHFLSSSLKEKLILSSKKLLESVQKKADTLHMPYHLAVKLAGIESGFGDLFKNEPLKQKGDKSLDLLAAKGFQFAWAAPELASDMIIGLQIPYTSLLSSPWQHFWTTICQFWNSETSSYAGPATKERFYKYEPRLTFLDLLLSYKSEKFPYRFFTDHPVHLLGALIKESSEALPRPLEDLKGLYEQCQYEIRHEPGYTLAAMQTPQDLNGSNATYWIGFKLQWGTLNRVRNFISQGGNVKSLDYHFLKDGIDLLFTLKDTVETADKEKAKEVEFFLDLQEGDSYLVKRKGMDALPATTFSLSDEVWIVTTELKVIMTFEVVKGTVDMIGHLMRGNRPSQTALKGDDRFSAFDEHLFLRTMRRSGEGQVKVSLRVEKRQ